MNTNEWAIVSGQYEFANGTFSPATQADSGTIQSMKHRFLVIKWSRVRVQCWGGESVYMRAEVFCNGVYSGTTVQSFNLACCIKMITSIIPCL